MTTIESLKAEQLQARKVKDTKKADRINVLISDIQRTKTNLQDPITEVEIQREINSTIKRLVICISKINENNGDASTFQEEVDFWSAYLPAPKHTEDEIKAFVEAAISSVKATSIAGIGAVMSELKKIKDMDMKAANQLLRQLLK